MDYYDKMFAAFIAAVTAACFALVGGLMYLDGSAKAAYLKQSGRGEYTAWQATFLPDSAFTDAHITLKEGLQ